MIKLSKEVSPEMIRYETKHHFMENPELPNISVKVVNRNRWLSYLSNKYLTEQHYQEETVDEQLSIRALQANAISPFNLYMQKINLTLETP
jgi:hypothetical protein